MPLISIIITTFNRCELLKRSLKSVFQQTFQDYELIVVNDGSTDNTINFLETIEDKRFTYVTFSENLGGNIARNEGVKRSKGIYCAFLDDDDSWVPQKLEKQIEILKNKEIDLCYTGIRRITNNKKVFRYIYHKPKFSDFHKSIMNDAFIGSISSVVVKKELINKVEGFDPNLPALQDWDIFIRLAIAGCRIYGIDKPLINYYVVDTSRSISCDMFQYIKAADYILEKYHDDPYINFLKRRLLIIRIKRIFLSRHFFFGFIKYYLSQLR